MRQKGKRTMSFLKKKPIKITLIVLGAIIALFIIGTVILGLCAKNADGVFPNVTANGVDISGLSESQAEAALIQSGLPSGESVSVTVTMTEDVSLSVTGSQTGVNITAQDAAKSAWQYGRNSGFFQGAFQYLKALFSEHEITIGDMDLDCGSCRHGKRRARGQQLHHWC